MGGRSSSFRKHSGGSQPRVMDEDEYLYSKGLGSPTSDVLYYKGGYERPMSANPKAREEKRQRTQIDTYHDKREQAMNDYRKLVDSGKVRPRTAAERAWRNAQGNAENRSVQAARRILTKRGIDYRTGKRIKGFTGRGYPEIDKRTGLELYKKNK